MLMKLSSTSESFLNQVQKCFTLGGTDPVAALVIVVCGYLGYKHFISEPKEAKASEALFRGEQYFGAESYELALNGDSPGICRFP